MSVRGSTVGLIAVPESAFKTPGSTGERLQVAGFTVAPSQQRVQSQTLSGRRGQARSVDGAKNVAGQIRYELAGEDLGLLLKHLVGAPTTTGSGPYTHTFVAAASGANALPVGLTLQADWGSAVDAASRYQQLNGCRFQQGQFAFTPNGLQTLAIDVVGSDWTVTNTDLDSTPVDLGHTNFEASNLSIALNNGSAIAVDLAAFNLTWGNDLDQDQYAIGGGGARSRLPEGFAIVSGSLTAFFTDEAMYDQVLSGSDFSAVITLSRGTGLGSAGNESLVITLPNLVCDKTAPPVDGPRGLRLQANFSGHRIGTAEQAASFVLKNATATIT